MSVLTANAESHGIKPSFQSVETDDRVTTPFETVEVTPKLGAESKRGTLGGNGFLSPLPMPIRPLSPDTLSNFSIDEFEQLQPSRSLQLPHNDDRSHPFSGRTIGWRDKLRAFWAHNLGLMYMLLAQFFGTLMNVTTRLLEIEGNKGKGLHPFQILFARMSLTLVMASAYMWWSKTPHFPLGAPGIRLLLVVRGFAGFFGVFGMYYSLLYLPLADATVITFLAPGLACWACSILINEPFTRIEQIGGLVSLAGVVLIARPTTLFQAFSDAPPATGSGDAIPLSNSTALAIGGDAASYDAVTPMQRLSAVAVSLLGVLGAATAYTTIRWIGKRAHPLITVNYFSGFSTVVSVVAQAVIPGVGFLLPADLKDWSYLLFLGACGFIMQFLLASGLSYEKSSRATNITYTQMLFALGADKIVFGHTPGLLSIIGSSLILGSAIVVALQKGSSSENSKPNLGGTQITTDEESQRGLISGVANLDDSGEVGRLPVEEVQMRTLR